MNNNHSNFLKVGLSAVKAAEEIILNYYHSTSNRINIKDDNTPVSDADIEAQKIIVDILKKNFPDHFFLGEENPTVDSLAEKEYVWIIDPIDGTKNYLHGIPLFGTEVALLRKGEIVLGISNAPAMNELLYAEKDGGAYLNGARISASKIDNINSSYVCFGGLKHFKRSNKIDNLANLCEKVHHARGIGDLWCYHLLAQGKIDAMIEAKIKIWDVAALAIIVKEAGGNVTDLEGEEINLDSTTMIATNGHLHKEIASFFE